MAGLEGLLTGRTLANRYRIGEVIGRGGMAAVYRAQDEVLGRTVAVKVITVAAPDEEGRARLQARFHREAQALARLQHPNVVTVFDFGTDAGLQLDFLVMELLRGEDLARRVAREGRLPPEQALRILREAAAGVGAGHREGLIHRDVKPGNLFLAGGGPGEDFRVRVLDFGIARIMVGDDPLTPLTRGHAPLSPAYASPEQLLGDRGLTPASDVYSLGVIGYELLAGVRLFAREDPPRVRDEVPPLRERAPEVSAAVAAVIERALAPEADDRYADAGALAEALDRALAPGAPAPAERQPPYRARHRPRLPRQPTHAVPAGRSRAAPLRVVVPVGVALVLAVLIGWWALRGEPGDGATGAGVPVAPATSASAPAPSEPREEAGSGGVGSAGASEDLGGLETEPGGASPAAGEPAAADALNQEGLRLFAAGDFGAAAQRFRRAVDAAPRSAEFRNNLGWALFRAGEVAAAARELEEVIRLDPGRDIVHANLGEVRLARGDTAGAIDAYRRFLELNTDPERERIAREKLRRVGAGYGQRRP